MGKRVQGLVIGVLVGALLAGGVAYAVTVVPPNDTDRYYACVSTAGVVRYGTVRLNVQPTTCPTTSDTIHSWNAKGPQGPAGTPSDVTAVQAEIVGNGGVYGYETGQPIGQIPPVITCQLDGLNDCSDVTGRGATMTLRARSSGWLNGWSEPSCPVAPLCTFTTTTSKKVTATFEPLAISGTYSAQTWNWTIRYTNNSQSARTGLTVSVSSVSVNGSTGPIPISSITTDRGDLNVVPYLPGWTVTNGFKVNNIDLGPGESVNISMYDGSPCNACAAAVKATLATDLVVIDSPTTDASGVDAMDSVPHTQDCANVPPSVGCRDYP